MSTLRVRLDCLALGLGLMLCLLLLGPATADEGVSAGEAAADGMLFVAIMELQISHDDITPEQGKALAGHIGHLKELYDAGVLLLAGPFDDESGQGMSLLSAADLDAARAICESDPTVQAGLMKIIAIHPWWDAFNAWEGRSMTMEEFVQMMGAPPVAEQVAGAQE